MEIVNPDGSTTKLEPAQTTELGRGQGLLNSSDKTVSRRHISFFFPPPTDENHEPRIQFEVLGRNPIFISNNNEVKMFRRFERGQVGDGDVFCVSAKDPVWYTFRKPENRTQGVRRNDLAGKLDSDVGFSGAYDFGEDEGVDIADIDPVKEFGFVVVGHEFDSYPKSMIIDFKNWEWFLEETGKGKDSDDDDSRRKHRRKRKKGVENDDDDEEWTGESEDDKELINKAKKAPRPKYSTRSKDHGKPTKDDRKNKGGTGKGKSSNMDEDEEGDEDEDEGDETLGGFIVGDENLEEDEEVDETEDEKEEEEEEEIDDDFDEDE